MSQNSLNSENKKTPKSAAELIDEAAKLIDCSQSKIEDKYSYPEKFEVPIVKRKREETVSDQVPSPDEIREKLEKVVESNIENKIPKKEETAQERRKRIRMMLLNSINGETVTDEVKQKQEEEKRAAEKAEAERIEAEARAERLRKELEERQAAERERHRLQEEEKMKKKRAEEAERRRKLEEQEEMERRRRRAPRCIADRKARKYNVTQKFIKHVLKYMTQSFLEHFKIQSDLIERCLVEFCYFDDGDVGDHFGSKIVVILSPT